MTGSLQPIPKLMHPVLGLADFQLYSKLPLKMDRQCGAVPSNAVQSELLGRLLQMTFHLGFNLLRQPGRTAWLLFRYQGFDPILIYRSRPAVYIHPGLP